MMNMQIRVEKIIAAVKCCYLWRNRNLTCRIVKTICLSACPTMALYWDHYYFLLYINDIQHPILKSDIKYSCLLMIPAYSYITQTPMNFLPLQMIALNNYQYGLLLINYIFILISPVIVHLVQTFTKRN